MKPAEYSDVVEKNTLILFNTSKRPVNEIICKCEDNAEFRMFECIEKYAEKIICPEHDHWTDL
jgi:hypothetical protein